MQTASSPQRPHSQDIVPITPPRQRNDGAGSAHSLAHLLGWFSLGLGAAQLLAPRAVSRSIGLGDDGGKMRMLGVREITSGLGILGKEQPKGWLWSRVGGDIMDLALLAAAFLRTPRGERRRLAAAAAAVAGVTALDLVASGRLTKEDTREPRRSRPGGIHITKSVTIMCTGDELYRFWRNLENLPAIMRHLESVQDLGGNRSRWKAKAPSGTGVEWEAEIISDSPNGLIAWRSLGEADVDHAGSVSFVPAPGGRGTEVHVELSYRPPAGRLGSIVAKLFGEEPGLQIAEGLRRFKQFMETGDVIVSDATLCGARLRQPAAQPPQMEPYEATQQGGVA